MPSLAIRPLPLRFALLPLQSSTNRLMSLKIPDLQLPPLSTPQQLTSVLLAPKCSPTFPHQGMHRQYLNRRCTPRMAMTSNTTKGQGLLPTRAPSQGSYPRKREPLHHLYNPYNPATPLRPSPPRKSHLSRSLPTSTPPVVPETLIQYSTDFLPGRLPLQRCHHYHVAYRLLHRLQSPLAASRLLELVVTGALTHGSARRHRQ